jgi:hypothetical protein
MAFISFFLNGKTFTLILNKANKTNKIYIVQWDF